MQLLEYVEILSTQLLNDNKECLNESKNDFDNFFDLVGSAGSDDKEIKSKYLEGRNNYIILVVITTYR